MGNAPDFVAPGPGEWQLDRSHYPGGTTPISQWLIAESMGAGMERVFAELGAPVRRVEGRFVNGFMYTRLVPLVDGDGPPRKPPPNVVLKLVTRVHPEFRRRRRTAARTLAEMPSLDVARRWRTEIAPRLQAENEALQAFDLAAADDAALERHIAALLDHLRDNFELHFWLHGHDLGPIARFVHACAGWGIAGEDAVRALAGASPSTVEPARALAELRAHAEGADAPVASLTDLRAVSDEAARLLDGYLARRGNVLATGYDITAFTLAELPHVVLESIRVATPPATADPAVAESLRERVPPEQRGTFDQYLAQARDVMDMRDDNGPLTVEWPTGLLRIALLEAGRRLVVRGAIIEIEQVFELSPDEARRLLTGELPTGTELEDRAARRSESSAAEPPTTLGATEPEPPLDVLPRPLPELVAMIQTAMRHLGMDGERVSAGLVGVGVGDATYRGRVCRAGSADEAIDKLQAGDVLVVRATSPAFNAVLTIAGAIVTADGGAMSHAAVLARELGIPAVVGAGGVLALPDGATVEVDPVEGVVRLVDELAAEPAGVADV